METDAGMRFQPENFPETTSIERPSVHTWKSNKMIGNAQVISAAGVRLSLNCLADPRKFGKGQAVTIVLPGMYIVYIYIYIYAYYA